ncbi:MAG TPA: hypothetical protein PK252_13835 [Bacteroidales bacterium]|nr:hypothetical protein [Bacteroidales bacterium]
MKKLILPSFLAAIASFAMSIAIGFAFMFIFPSLNDEYSNTSIFRTWEDPLMYIYFLQPFFFAFTLAWIWTKVKKLFAENIMNAAFTLTGAYWLVATIPGMLISYSSYQISSAMVLSWTVSSFFQTYVASLVIIKMEKRYTA